MGARSLLIFHPQRLIREVWTAFLHSREFINVIGNAGNFDELVAEIAARRPNICIARVDLGHLADLCGLAAVRKANAATKIILVCPTYPAAVGTLLNRIGIQGYLTKDISLNEMHTAILKVGAGFPYRSASLVTEPANADTIEFANQLAELTKKELEILNLSLTGKTAREIACQLGLSLKTVEVHRYHILHKLSCSKTLQVFNKLQLYGIGE